jgi:predicted phage terminase large subunit-like protein
MSDRYTRLQRLHAQMAARLAVVRRERAEQSLYEFVKQYWHIVEPANPLIHGWVLEAICLHLTAITEGDTQRVIINVPPGCMKSLMSSVFWPAWEWGPRKMPSMRYAAFSYTSTLTERDNERMMNLITSPEYRQNWPLEVFGGKIKLQNGNTGWKLATSISGVGTGERADRLLLDDLNNVKEAESKAILDSTNKWIREVMPSRLNHLSRSAVIAIQQRTSEMDCTGTLVLGRDDWTWLMIPMRYEPDRHCVTTIGWSDPRAVEGELCWPERFAEEDVVALEREMGPYAVAGQLQQSPSPRGGGIILRSWWQDWPNRQFPPMHYVVAALDTAMTEKEESDYSALSVWGSWHDSGQIVGDEWSGYDFVQSLDPTEDRTPVIASALPKIMLMKAWRDRYDLPRLVERILLTWKRWKFDTLVIENKAHGYAVQQSLRSMFSSQPFSVLMYNPPPRTDKSARLYSVQHLFAEGMVYAPLEKDWADEMITEISQFPRAAHDDYTDTASMALAVLRQRGFMPRKEDAVRGVIGQMRHKARSAPLYPV